MTALPGALLDDLRSAVGEPGMSTDPADRDAVAHDLWPRALIRERAGEVLPGPDAVVWPATREQVAAVCAACHRAGVPLTPFGAGTGVCGAAIPVRGGVVLDLKRLDRILAWDLESGWVVVEPGLLGVRLEEACRERGRTTGHHPSSLALSTVGGFVATRSAGQLSTRYGRIDDLVAGLEAVLPDGTPVSLRAQPSSGAGPDLRRLFLGSEGGFGVVVEVTLRLHPLPERRVDHAAVFDGFAAGVAAVRELLQAGLRPSLLRLYDPADTALQAAELGVGEGSGALLLSSCEGRAGVAEAEAAELAAICASHGGSPRDPAAVEAWYRRRDDIGFAQARYLPLPGAVLDTVELAAPWPRLVALHQSVRRRLGGRLIVLCHLCHGYPDGACLYFSFAGVTGDDGEALRLHEELWEEVMAAAAESGASIAHHHGAGLARAPYLAGELG
ncbi:MAG TPA: FAD-binding oxidoreductase, partial [Candidatus Dormibacteraeota bacterium]|nr:FAD-binding oxidoreductase [Candidatus Dormibacteraeota bacterium]